MDDRPWADAVPAGAAHLTLGTAADGLVLLAVVLAACAVAWRLGARAAGCPLCGRAFEADHHPAVEDRPAAQVRALRRVR
ncbi:MAG: hypothetical protein NW201_13990 [Gemmatimonadales bacterium]|nr:hypothetical protein [Gemmatimonadales bacterium]